MCQINESSISKILLYYVITGLHLQANIYKNRIELLKVMWLSTRLN